MDLDVLGGDVPLKDFVQRTRQVCGTATRRILDDPTGVNREKLFSVFETHTPLDQRGKAVGLLRGTPVDIAKLIFSRQRRGYRVSVGIRARGQGGAR